MPTLEPRSPPCHPSSWSGVLAFKGVVHGSKVSRAWLQTLVRNCNFECQENWLLFLCSNVVIKINLFGDIHKS